MPDPGSDDTREKDLTRRIEPDNKDDFKDEDFLRNAQESTFGLKREKQRWVYSWDLGYAITALRGYHTECPVSVLPPVSMVGNNELFTLNNLSTLSPGFDARLVWFDMDASLSGYTSEKAKIFYQQLTDSLSSNPAVQSVGLAAVRILEDDEWDRGMTAEGYNPSRPDDWPQPYMNMISPSYFATLGIPIMAGRDFTLQDNHEVFRGPQPDNWTPTTVIINQKFARRYFAGQNSIGRHLGFGTDPGTRTDMEIIGVVKDIKYMNLRDDIPEQALFPTSAATLSAA